MEMHQAMWEELNDLYITEAIDRTWEDTNVLASLLGALEDLFVVYGELAESGRTPPGAYEGTSLTRPCNGSKRVSKYWKGGQGGKERTGERRHER